MEWDRLSKRYPGSGRPALNAISFDVQDREIVGLVGLNGAGKTTAIRVASGVTLPSGGTVRIDGQDIRTQKVRASRTLGWVPELPVSDPDRRALPTLEYYAGFYGLRGAAARERGQTLLDTVGLHGMERVKLRKFSQGMFKRFNLAASMVGDPTNILLDEVLNGIDPQGILFVRKWVTELRGQGKAILLSSHQLAEVERVADRVAFLHQGRVIRIIRRSELATLATGETRVRVTIPNLDQTCLIFLGTLGRVEALGNTVTVIGSKVDPAGLNRELVQRGYNVTALHTEATPLEDYFMTLLGKAQ